MTTPDDAHDYAAIVPRHRKQLIAVLDSLPAADFETLSLCEGWRITEVLAHITMPFRFSPEQYGAELASDNYDFTAMADRTAKRDAQAGPTELLEVLKANADTLWAPPGGGLRGGLSHDVIHGLDMTVPLGRDTKLDDDVLAAVLSGFDEASARQYFGFDPAGIRLQANDFDYTLGDGELVSGSAQDLMMTIAGRTLPAGRLTGPGSARFASR